jgi:2',3'-cyclic-nucleotide 2'-phosphodiesterase (5'-nucleotidase family)
VAAAAVILHTNDLHGQLTPERLAILSGLRSSADLYFDAGDSVKSGNLAAPLFPEPCWPRLAEARVTATCPGNRESHVLSAAVAAKFRGASHPVLCANWRTKAGALVWPASKIFEAGGLRVGVVAGMVAMVTPRMKTAPASAYLWDPPIAAIQAEGERLRPECDLLIALTHIGFTQDQRLAEACPLLDLIIGGHSHTVLEQPDRSAGVPIVQAGSHGRFIGRLEWESGRGLRGAELLPWAS